MKFKHAKGIRANFLFTLYIFSLNLVLYSCSPGSPPGKEIEKEIEKFFHKEPIEIQNEQINSDSIASYFISNSIFKAPEISRKEMIDNKMWEKCQEIEQNSKDDWLNDIRKFDKEIIRIFTQLNSISQTTKTEKMEQKTRRLRLNTLKENLRYANNLKTEYEKQDSILQRSFQQLVASKREYVVVAMRTIYSSTSGPIPSDSKLKEALFNQCLKEVRNNTSIIDTESKQELKNGMLETVYKKTIKSSTIIPLQEPKYLAKPIYSNGEYSGSIKWIFLPIMVSCGNLDPVFYRAEPNTKGSGIEFSKTQTWIISLVDSTAQNKCIKDINKDELNSGTAIIERFRKVAEIGRNNDPIEEWNANLEEFLDKYESFQKSKNKNESNIEKLQDDIQNISSEIATYGRNIKSMQDKYDTLKTKYDKNCRNAMKKRANRKLIYAVLDSSEVSREGNESEILINMVESRLSNLKKTTISNSQKLVKIKTKNNQYSFRDSQKDTCQFTKMWLVSYARPEGQPGNEPRYKLAYLVEVQYKIDPKCLLDYPHPESTDNFKIEGDLVIDTQSKLIWKRIHIPFPLSKDMVDKKVMAEKIKSTQNWRLPSFSEFLTLEPIKTLPRIKKNKILDVLNLREALKSSSGTSFWTNEEIEKRVDRIIYRGVLISKGPLVTKKLSNVHDSGMILVVRKYEGQ